MANNEHTSKQFDAELEAVRARVLQMGGLVESQIRLAVESLVSGDVALMNKVIGDDHRVNAMEVEIDESCSRILVRRQPAAGDLRMVMTVIKTITDLERIGDEAEKIARMAKLLSQQERCVCRAITRSNARRRSRSTCCANRWMRLRGSTWPRRRRSCVRTNWWTRNSAPSCVT